jgi:GNAT superfamily N-acetyltransferase
MMHMEASDPAATPPAEIPARGRIRPARPDEVEHLSGLAFRAKAHWGYDAAFMAACIPALTVSVEQVTAPDRRLLVAEDEGGTVVGFAALHLDTAAAPDTAELTDLFVEPRAIGQGYGWRLWQQAMALARSLGVREVRIESDPFAEPFYLRQGAVRIGETPSSAIPGRVLPLLRCDLAGDGSPE